MENKIEPSLRIKLKRYKERAGEVERYLSKHPAEWAKFQDEFNSEVNNIFRDIMNFERENFVSGHEEKVYKLKKIFINRIRRLFLRGVYNKWSFSKPFGYAGDFKIIDDIYKSEPTTIGFDRLFDNYFLVSAISVAVRNRKEDFKKLIIDFINKRCGKKLLVMDLASGPCRELKEIMSSDSSLYSNVAFDCYENDINAIEYAKKLLTGYSNVNIIKENALRIAFRKDIRALIDKKYDLIYSTGLFDYFNERIGTALVKNLKKILKPDGIIAISTVTDRYNNPSVHYMEWAGDWNLIYRDSEEFIKIFLAAGFNSNEIEIQHEEQTIMQYIIAHNKI